MLRNVSLQYPMEKPYYQSIADTLLSLRRPEQYVVGGKAAMPTTEISITGISKIVRLPICEAQAKHIVELASRVPCGREDNSVCCTWQLTPTQFAVTNSQWEESLQQLLDKVKLECNTKMRLSCELSKLLLYEPGGFFKVGNIVALHCNFKIG